MPEQVKVSPGDFTGKEKKQQSREALQEQRDRAHEMSMMTAVAEEEERSGVFDPQTGDLLERGLENPDVEEVDDGGFPQSGFGFNPRPREQTFTGKETEAEMEPFLSSTAAPPAPVVRATLSSPVVKIRTNCDIEDMTYGMLNGLPNNFTFREGYTYQVSRDLAEHLNERHLIAQWVG